MAKIAYLTIDDSPSKDMKSKVDYLLAKSIPAIWFCRGEFMEQHLPHVTYAIENGFIIGNHSYTHPYFSTLSLAQCAQEISKTEQLIEQAYQIAGVKRPYKCFRFPYGDKGGGTDIFKTYSTSEQQHVQALQRLLKEEGFQRIKFEGIRYSYYQQARLDLDIDAFWTFDTKDYAALSPHSRHKHQLHTIEDFLKLMDENRPEEGFGLNDSFSNEIIILHDFPQLTELFQPMINKLMTKDLVFQLPNL